MMRIIIRISRNELLVLYSTISRLSPSVRPPPPASLSSPTPTEAEGEGGRETRRRDGSGKVQLEILTWIRDVTGQ